MMKGFLMFEMAAIRCDARTSRCHCREGRL